MNEHIITLKSYENMVEAMLDHDILTQNRIENNINHEDATEVWPMLNEINQGLQIVVFENDCEKALQVLDNYHNSGKSVI